MFKADAVILAGGQGLRLRPYTTILPKPLLPLGDFPILEILIRQLRHHGFKNIIISVGYLAALIEVYFGRGEKWGVNIRYVREKDPLGTAGALKMATPTENNFLVLNGDVLTDMDFAALLKWHVSRKAMATIAVKKRTIQSDFGVIDVGSKHELIDYHEKPKNQSFVSMGVNVFHASAIDYIGSKEVIGMPDLMLRLKSKSKDVSCYEFKKTWLDLGRFEDFETAQEIFKRHQKRFIKS